MENDVYTSENVHNVNYGFIDDKIMRMMSNMNFKTGNGLGRNNQGILYPLEMQSQFSRKGFGHETQIWDCKQEHVVVEEKVNWLVNLNCDNFSDFNICEWMKVRNKKLTIFDETKFCNADLLQQVINSKKIFDVLDCDELCKARTRANPFEMIKNAFFMNRAALKMANIDAASDFLFTTVDRQEEHKQLSNPYYFADICAGPGGFSEYILWRKKWGFKGFGMTLKGDNDFKLYESTCAACETFESFYGPTNDGNVYYPENITAFEKFIKQNTNNLGVHFVMADGGFSVEGQEEIQEILSHQIYICQCFIALKILRKNGHFVVKLFDLFTPFSVGLIYLMRQCFHKIAIFKPNSSRPANSERYLICAKLKDNQTTTIIRYHISKVVNTLFDIKTKKNSDLDVLEIVPEHIIKSDQDFIQYIIQSNNTLAERQIIALKKLEMFCRDPSLLEPRQEQLRQQCLAYWRIPDKIRCSLTPLTADDILFSVCAQIDFLFSEPTTINNKEELECIIDNSHNWHYTFLSGTKKFNFCKIYIGLGRNKVYRFAKNRWSKITFLELVRGSIIFAETVNEFCKEDKQKNIKSLHIIDALRLGDISIADFSYQERLELINIYCRAVNRETRTDLNAIRVKPMFSLTEIVPENFPIEGNLNLLPCINSNVPNPIFEVHSMMLIKTDSSQTFNSSICSRVIINLDFPDLKNSSIWEYFITCYR